MPKPPQTTDRTAILKDFDTLPDAAAVRVRMVAALLDCTPTTVWRLARRGEIPKPRKIGSHMTYWRAGELRQLLSGAAA